MLKLFKSGRINKKVSGENIKFFLRDRRGQSLIEVLIGLTIGALIIGGVSAGLVSSLRSNMQTKQDIIATEIAQKTMDNVRVLAESDWNKIYNPAGNISPTGKGDGTKYYIYSEGATFVVEPLTELNRAKIEANVESIIYTPSFTVDNVLRDSNGAIIDSGTTYDPSTQKIIISVSWKTIGTSERTISIASYVTRTKNISTLFADWSAGSGVEGPVTSANSGFSSSDNLDYSVQGQIKVSGY
jgi:hypothetical protein